ncbi:anion permease [Pseudomonas sp. MAFF 301449]|uniref:Anion permease n=1 Tax=Pseudomonas cyclaminis TaxID=2781239 RepID=A0ABR9SRK4_9PSED|nr:SLC13 family permease [Pseudomonas cyclaminis]MBE8591555.1 anion permease [Pseudomonas cyclaminis]
MKRSTSSYRATPPASLDAGDVQAFVPPLLGKAVVVSVFYTILIGLLVGAYWMVLPPELPIKALQAALVVGFTLGAWAFGLLDEPTPTLFFFLLVVLFGIAPTDVVFSGFSSTAWWLVFGGSVLGVAIKTTGLGTRIAAVVFSGKTQAYNGYLLRVALVSVVLAFLMPSTTGRILLLTPIVLALAKELGFEPGSNGHTGLVLAVAASSYMPPTAILPANLPNSVLLGAAESMYGIHLSYGSYLLAHFPILGVLKALVIVVVITYLFPESRPCQPLARSKGHRLSSEEQRLFWVLAFSVLLYMTDFIHGISPAWVSLGAAIVCLLPAMNIISTKALTDGVHITPLIYVAGFLGLGAVVADSGIGFTLGRSLLTWTAISPDHPAAAAASLTAIGAGIGLITTLPSLPAVLTPLASEFSNASGLSLNSILMLQVPAFGLLLFPYQCPPIILAMTMGSVRLKDATKLFLAVALITVLVLFPLDYLWWRQLGLI